MYGVVGNRIFDVDTLGNAAIIIVIPITITITEVVVITSIAATGICLSNNKCRQTAKNVLLIPILAVIKAAKSVAKYGCKLRCKFANHPPHHSFKSYRIGMTTSIINCWKRHFQLNCWIKGKKTGFKAGVVRVPYGECYQHKNEIPSGIWSIAITPYPFTINEL